MPRLRKLINKNNRNGNNGIMGQVLYKNQGILKLAMILMSFRAKNNLDQFIYNLYSKYTYINNPLYLNKFRCKNHLLSFVIW